MRMLAVADVYEALTSDRPYRAAMTSNTALEVMRPEVPERLDGEAFAALEGLLSTRDDAAGIERAEAVLQPRRD